MRAPLPGMEMPRFAYGLGSEVIAPGVFGGDDPSAGAATPQRQRAYRYRVAANTLKALPAAIWRHSWNDDASAFS
jgi:hypothetical protein